jgi:thiol:disulfide interchange protein
MVMLELGEAEAARNTLEVFAGQMEHGGEGMSSMVEAALLYLAKNEPFTAARGPWRGDRPHSPQELANEVVSMQAAWISPDELHVQLAIAEGYHINAHQAARDLIATQLSVSGQQVDSIRYPEGEQRRFAFTENPIRVYIGNATIEVKFKSAMTGQPPVRMGIAYQACDEQACLPPVTRQIEVNTP